MWLHGMTFGKNEIGLREIMTENDTIVKVQQLKKYYRCSGGWFNRTPRVVRAVDGVSFDIYAGETLGIVGESGSGKSTIGRNILQLERPTAGTVFFEGKELTSMSQRDLLGLRKRMQIVFQDPYASLNPRIPVGKFVEEPLKIHKVIKDSRKRQDLVKHLFEKVGLDPNFVTRYPHEFSGGQRQRVGIARAIVLNPSFIIADEPITALDVSIQSQIVNLFQDLQKELKLTYLFIAHDLSMIRYLCHRVAVMYRGRIVELAPTNELYENPIHPYTQVLLSSVPVPDPAIERKRKRSKFDLSRLKAGKEASFEEISPGHFVAPFWQTGS